MKKRIQVFVALVLAGMLLIPGLNLWAGAPLQDKQWWRQDFLFNMDLLSGRMSLVLSRIGISTDPSQVVVGREGWFYLGDKYEQTLTVARTGQTLAEVEMGKRIGDAADAWERWLGLRGVRVYRVMIAPDKGTIYPEFLPNWAQPASPSATDALMAGNGDFRFIDLRPALLAAKNASIHPL